MTQRLTFPDPPTLTHSQEPELPVASSILPPSRPSAGLLKVWSF